MSAISTATRPGSGWKVRTVITPPSSGVACAALVRRFRNTWFICDGAHGTFGIWPSSCLTVRFFSWFFAIVSAEAIPSFRSNSATLLRSRRAKFFRLVTSSAICPMP